MNIINRMKKSMAIMLIIFLAINLCTNTYVNAGTKRVKVLNAKNGTITMYKGAVKKLRLNLSVSNFIFKSKKTSVAKINDDGVLVAGKKGKTQISILNKRGKDVCKVKVVVKKPVGYTINKTSGTYTNAQKIKIKAKKGYKVYFSTGKKFSKKKFIKSKKIKNLLLSESTNLYVYAVKNTKKVSLGKVNKNMDKYAILYKYDINAEAEITSEKISENIVEETTTTSNGGINRNESESECESSAIIEEIETVINEEKDTDGDGLADYIEEYLGSDSKKIDTDMDGLNDYIEVHITSTDPLCKDSDSNGIDDVNEDTDNDGLSNLSEIKYGTEANETDSDNDGITDNDEIYKYLTEPQIRDTDSDGASDGWEIENGYNPSLKNSKFSVEKAYIPKENEKTIPTLIVDEASGEQIDSLKIEKCEENAIVNEDIPGYLGEYYEFSMDGDMKSAQITFEFDDELWSESFYPAIYYYNESKQLLEKLENQVVNGNTVSATTTHFSKYMLLNDFDFLNIYTGSIIWEPDVIETSSISIAFVIDTSSSMNENDPQSLRKALTIKQINKLTEKDYASIIGFNGSATVYSGFDNDHYNLKQAVDSIKTSGTTAVYEGVRAGIDEFKRTNVTVLSNKVMFVLTDGLDSSSSYTTEMYDDLADEARALGITIYTVGLGSVDRALLTRLAVRTGGVFYHADDYTELYMGFNLIEDEIDLSQDTNNDGICDYYTELMCDGTIRDGLGKKVFGDATYEEVQSNSDYDEDGVINGDEVDVTQDGDIIYAKELMCPLLPDTDYDGVNDDEDERPLSNSFNATLQKNYGSGDNKETIISEIEYCMNYKIFFGSNNEYSQSLSTVSSILSALAYKESYIDLENYSKEEITYNSDIEKILSELGLSRIEGYYLGGESQTGDMRVYKTIYDDNDISEIYMGYRTVINEKKEERNVVCIVVRGTNGTLKEWSSNFDIGSVINGSDITGWNNTDNHRGFDVTTNRILRFVEKYVDTNLGDKENVCYWITGHSRGAGIANLLSANLIDKGNDVRGYTFAAPATTTSSEVKNAKYNSIFNIINTDDFVPRLPLEEWYFQLYGKNATQSIDDLYEEEWEQLTNCKTIIGSFIPTPIVDYNNDQFGLEETITSMAGIADNRDECYEYNIEPEGAIVTKHRSYIDALCTKNAVLGSYAVCLSETYKAEIIKEEDDYVLYIYQKPVFLMQLLAAVMAPVESGINAKSFAKMDVAKYLEDAKWGVIWSKLGGINHPHYTESYYLLSTHITEGDFN